MTKIINIASLRKPTPVIIEVGEGAKAEKHELVPASVDTFLEHLREVEALGLNASPIQEAELIIKAIARAFPTLDQAIIRSWPIDIVRNLYFTVITANGEVVSNDPAEIEKAEKTGKSAPAV